MKTYKVSVIRIGYSFKEILVEANVKQVHSTFDSVYNELKTLL